MAVKVGNIVMKVQTSEVRPGPQPTASSSNKSKASVTSLQAQRYPSSSEPGKLLCKVQVKVAAQTLVRVRAFFSGQSIGHNLAHIAPRARVCGWRTDLESVSLFGLRYLNGFRYVISLCHSKHHVVLSPTALLLAGVLFASLQC